MCVDIYKYEFLGARSKVLDILIKLFWGMAEVITKNMQN